MASTYSPLKLELMATGEKLGVWGNITNINLGTALEEAIVGSADITFASADVTITLLNTNAAQTARNLRLRLIGVSGGARNLIVPSIEKNYIIKNETADPVTVKNAAGTGVAVPAGASMLVYNDGVNVTNAVTASTGTFVPPDGSVWSPTSLANVSKIGIGMVPVNPLDITKNQNAPSIASLLNNDPGASALAQWTANNGLNSISVGVWGQNFPVSGPFASPSRSFITSNAGLVLNTINAAPIIFGTGNVEKMRLDANGNLGVGRVPDAIAASQKQIAIGASGSLVGGVGSGSVNLVNNLYYDGATYRTIVADYGSLLALNTGAHVFYSAPNVAAGAATTITERMRLDNNGNLGLGLVPEVTWSNQFHAAQIGYLSLVGPITPSAASAVIACNLFTDGANWRRLTAAGGALCTLDASVAGAWAWYNSPTGAAGSVAPLTLRMVLDGSGNLTLNGSLTVSTAISAPARKMMSGGKSSLSSGGVYPLFSVPMAATDGTAVLVTLYGTNQDVQQCYSSTKRQLYFDIRSSSGDNQSSGAEYAATNNYSINSGVISLTLATSFSFAGGIATVRVSPTITGAAGSTLATVFFTVEAIGGEAAGLTLL